MDRLCVRCHERKPASEFYLYSPSWCKICRRKYERDRRSPPKRPRPGEGRRRCASCSQELLLDQFRRRSNGGWYSYCRDCQRARNEASRRLRVQQPRGSLGSQWASWRTTGHHHCPACGVDKPLGAFSWEVKRQRPRGWCRLCSAKRHKVFMRTEAGKAAARRYNQTRDQRKHWVRVFTQAAVRLGMLIRWPCEVCGVTKVQAHHVNYAEPLNVRWLCKAHHDDVHRKEDT